MSEVERKKRGPNRVVNHGFMRPEKRVPMTAGGKLNWTDQEDGWEYRFCDGDASKLQEYVNAWWEFVEQNGERVFRPSGEKGLYLMRIKSTYFQESKDLKLKQTKAILRKENELEADEYVPDGKVSALQSEEYDPLK